MTPFDWTRREVEIVKGAWATDAGRLALEIVMTRLGDIHGLPPSVDALSLAAHTGRRFVAVALKDAITKPAEQLVKEPHEPRSPIRTATERAADLADGQ